MPRPDHPTPADLLQALQPAVLAAGALIENLKQHGYRKWRKADRSPVTNADTAAEKLLTDTLHEIDPDTPVIGEEAAATGLAGEKARRYWLIDPVDGTVAFISGGADYSVNVGLIEDGYPTLGLVYHSPTGTLWQGARGMGATRTRGGVTHPIRTRPYQTPPTIAVSHSPLGRQTTAWIARIPGAKVIRRGASLKICMLAEGAADLYPRHGHTYEWDTAAGDAILRAAGGTLLGHGMKPLVYGLRPGVTPPFANPPFLVVGDPSVIPALPPFPEEGAASSQDSP